MLELGLAGCHGHFFQRRGLAGGQPDGGQNHPRRWQFKRRAPEPRKPHLRRRHPVVPARRRFQPKGALFIAELGFYHRRVGGSVQGDGGKFHCRARGVGHGAAHECGRLG